MIHRGLAHVRLYGLRSLVRHSVSAAIGFVARKRTQLRARWRFLTRTLPLRFGKSRLAPNTDPEVVASLTSFPARIRTVWATIETLMRQSRVPDAIILVLSLEEFPTMRVPRSIRLLERRGVTLHWIDSNIGSYGKLVPARQHFPSATIITVDDDVLYASDMLDRLLAASSDRPGWIVGHRGWNPIRSMDGYQPYVDWMRAGYASPESDTDEVFLTGVGGVLYPPNALDADLLVDIELALQLAPKADDVWFWAVARISGTKRYCTGETYGETNGLEQIGPSLFFHNRAENDMQIAATVHHLGL